MSNLPTEKKPFKAGFFTILKFIFFLGLGGFFIWLSLKDLTGAERTAIIKSFQTADYNWVFLGVGLGILSHIFRALRWMMFLKPMGYQPKFRNAFFAVMIGYLANLAFPRLGEVTRCGIISQYEKIPFNKSLGTVITERAIDLIIFFLLFGLMIFTQMGTIQEYLNETIYPKLVSKFGALHYSRLLWMTGLGLLFLGVILFFVFRKRLKRFSLYRKLEGVVTGFWEGLKSLTQIRHPWLFLFYTLSIWVLYFLMLYVCFFCFTETAHLSPGAGLSALVLGSIGIMITPGGIGLYPTLIQETLKLYGISLVTGLALGWITWTTQTLMILVLGSFSLLFLSFNKTRNGTSGHHKK